MYSEKELTEIHEHIKRKLKDYTNFAMQKQVNEMVNIFSEDGILVSPNGMVHGKDEIAKFYTSFLANIHSSDLSINSLKIFEVDGRIYEMGTNKAQIGEGKNMVTLKGNYFSIWIKKDNEWFIQEDLIPPMPE